MLTSSQINSNAHSALNLNKSRVVIRPNGVKNRKVQKRDRLYVRSVARKPTLALPQRAHHVVDGLPPVPGGAGHENLLDLAGNGAAELVVGVAVPRRRRIAAAQGELQQIRELSLPPFGPLVRNLRPRGERKLLPPSSRRLILTGLRGDPLKIDLYSSSEELCNFTDAGNNQLLFQPLSLFPPSFVLWPVCARSVIIPGPLNVVVVVVVAVEIRAKSAYLYM